MFCFSSAGRGYYESKRFLHWFNYFGSIKEKLCVFIIAGDLPRLMLLKKKKCWYLAEKPVKEILYLFWLLKQGLIYLFIYFGWVFCLSFCSYCVILFLWGSSTNLLHSAMIIDETPLTRRCLAQALAQQFFGCFISRMSW